MATTYYNFIKKAADTYNAAFLHNGCVLIRYGPNTLIFSLDHPEACDWLDAAYPTLTENTTPAERIKINSFLSKL